VDSAPPAMRAMVARSGLGNELNMVPVDKLTLLSKAYPNIFALGDASDIPTSKAGQLIPQLD
jgi:sulfide:quinone oxidoreductase